VFESHGRNALKQELYGFSLGKARVFG
jgi:hypothetical protein